MRSFSPLSFLLLLVFSSICFALTNEFWKSINQVADQAEPEAREYFLRTGQLPSEGTSSSSPSTDIIRHPHGLQAWTPFARPHPSAEIFQPTLPNHYVERTVPSPSSQISSLPHADHTPAGTLQSNWIRSETSHDIGTGTLGLHQIPEVLDPIQRQSILQRVANRFQAHAQRDAESHIHPLNGVLTADLVHEAFGYPNILLRYLKKDRRYFKEDNIEEGIFLVPRLDSGYNEDFTQKHGGMSLTSERKYHVYVWKRYAVQGSLGSVFQLVGAVETAITTPAIKRRLLGYHTDRKVHIISEDSIFDASRLTA
ncbi:uncharacterized protein UTRI_02784 [Ustilago trichophora]|uniref:Effector family protein Eff1 n=1 Tax=Ustilago trichophora TaxID=86804 RepID=A0A5C3ER00_9BASI|nr:uncharacterized protein UTRI_02784 [Ustilago trichophora]